MYKNMHVCSDHLVGGSPSTFHDVNNPEWPPSLKLVFETVAENTLQARSKSYERAIKRRKLCNELCAEVDKIVDEVVVEDDTKDDHVAGDWKSVAVKATNDSKSAIVQTDMCIFSFRDLRSGHVVEELESELQ